MAALGTLLATGDSAVGSWVTDAGGTTNLYLKIDEGIAGATDTNDYIQAPNDTNNADYKCTLADTPADFGAMSTLSYDIRYCLSAAPPASSKDTYGLSIRIVSGATILAANDSGGTFQVVVSTTTMSTSFANKGSTAFTYVNTSADKTAWDAAVVEIRQTYTASGSKDAHAVRVSTFEITGTYAAPKNMVPGSGSATYTGKAPSLGMAPKTGAVTYTGKAPSLGMSPKTGAATYTGKAPSIQTPRNVVVGAGAATFTGFAPSVTVPVSVVVNPLTGAVVVTGIAPTVQTPVGVGPSAGSAAYDGFAPVWAEGTLVPIVVTPTVGQLTFDSFAPRVFIILPTVVGGGIYWPRPETYRKRRQREDQQKRRTLPPEVLAALWDILDN